MVYLETIPVNRRIRDLAEGRDGRVLLWTGERDVLVIARGQKSEGERAYGSCVECHGADLTGTIRGPSLRDVSERRIATSDFEFSPALRSLGGSWNDERLDAFLRDPQAYAPGTSMAFPGIPEERARRLLIAYLRLNF